MIICYNKTNYFITNTYGYTTRRASRTPFGQEYFGHDLIVILGERSGLNDQQVKDTFPIFDDPNIKGERTFTFTRIVDPEDEAIPQPGEHQVILKEYMPDGGNLRAYVVTFEEGKVSVWSVEDNETDTMVLGVPSR